jgi:3-isopropylmalate/(R)-2-methylmalate dehydratase large subunit
VTGSTLYDKLWASHRVAGADDGSDLIYIDRHLLHEVSTPQSFEILKAGHRKVRRPSTNLAVADHAVPTHDRGFGIADPMARAQVARLQENCQAFGIDYIPLNDVRQGIVHVIGPELGFTLPGLSLVCGDSHTSTHGAFGALAFGVGATECAVVMAAQTLWQRKSGQILVRISGRLHPQLSAKDLSLALISAIGAGGGAGCAIEYAGEAVREMSMAGRMTLCNMSIECGARIGLVAPDETTFAYVKGRPRAPKGEMWDRALAYWRTLKTDEDAVFDRIVDLDAEGLAPYVTWGVSPEHAAPVTAKTPDPATEPDPGKRAKIIKALEYMGLHPGMALSDIRIDKVFIGSCTNGRIEDLRAAAAVLYGRKIASTVFAMIAPGSTSVKLQAEAEGLHKVFLAAGFEWRDAGCSMCVAMNDDRLKPGERCASTSNRNFEGRQGPGGRTHLMSPAMAAAAAVSGHLVDVRHMATS